MRSDTLSGRVRVALALCALASVACDSSDGAHGSAPDGSAGGADASGGTKGQGGASGGKGGAAGGTTTATGGASGSAGGAVTCGGEACTTSSDDTGVQARPCCTDDGACGVRIPLSPRCLPRNQFGTTNAGCAPYDIPNFTLPGCCRADGCGARITFENLGCVSNEDLSRAAVPCNQDGTPAGDGG
jgi:hypothetical protein